MAYDRNKVIAVAVNEIGYHEKASNSNLDSKTANSGGGNWNKFARDLDAIGNFYNGPKNGYAWCEIFVDWCFVKAYGEKAAYELLCQPMKSTGAGCMYSADFYKKAGQWYSRPEPGDQVYFSYRAGEISHTGIVETVNGNSFTTIEGNTSDQVMRRSYTLPNSQIVGFGRPDWSLGGSAAPTPTPTPDSGNSGSVRDRYYESPTSLFFHWGEDTYVEVPPPGIMGKPGGLYNVDGGASLIRAFGPQKPFTMYDMYLKEVEKYKAMGAYTETYPPQDGQAYIKWNPDTQTYTIIDNTPQKEEIYVKNQGGQGWVKEGNRWMYRGSKNPTLYDKYGRVIKKVGEDSYIIDPASIEQAANTPPRKNDSVNNHGGEGWEKDGNGVWVYQGKYTGQLIRDEYGNYLVPPASEDSGCVSGTCSADNSNYNDNNSDLPADHTVDNAGEIPAGGKPKGEWAGGHYVPYSDAGPEIDVDAFGGVPIGGLQVGSKTPSGTVINMGIDAEGNHFVVIDASKH